MKILVDLNVDGTLTVGGQTVALTSDLHSHANKSILDLLSESGGVLLYDGEPVAGEGSATNLTPTTLELGNFRIAYNSTEDTLDFQYIV